MKQGNTPEIDASDIDTDAMYPEDSVFGGIYTRQTIREMMSTRLKPQLIVDARTMCLEYGIPYNEAEISSMFDEVHLNVENAYTFWPHWLTPRNYANKIKNQFIAVCNNWAASQAQNQ